MNDSKLCAVYGSFYNVPSWFETGLSWYGKLLCLCVTLLVMFKNGLQNQGYSCAHATISLRLQIVIAQWLVK